MTSKQYCSVCKQWLDMEAVSNGDPEEDDGVTWFRCPGCQGFLPKLNVGADEMSPSEGASAPQDEPEPEGTVAVAEATPVVSVDTEAGDGDDLPDADAPGEETDPEKSGDLSAEQRAAYAAMLAEADVAAAQPYRPWESYEVGQCVLHLAWNDCGIVVGKESLPGGRQVIKVYFSEAGVMRLIENAPR